MYKKMVRPMLSAALAGALCAGCETKAQSGALVGGAGGAGLGAVIGHQSGHAGTGALIGGAVGALGGAVVGNEMDKKDERRARESYPEPYSESPRARTTATEPRVTRNDVVAWSAEGKSEDVIVDRIERSGSTFNVTPEEETRLRKAGVGDRVIEAMKTSRSASVNSR